MCLGLGSGLGFFYFQNPHGATPSHLFFGRTLDLERDLCAHLALDFDEGAEDDDARAWQTAKDFVDRDIPVLLHVELSQLPYYNTRTPFPGHRVVLAGYDDARRVAFLADTQFPGLQEISYAALRAARATKIPPLPLRSEWLVIKSPVIAKSAATKQSPTSELEIVSRRSSAGVTLRDAIRAALRDNALGMNLDRAPHFAVMGMETLAEDFENWSDYSDWDACARFGYQNIEVRGTGGGFFRKMHAQFLREAEALDGALRAARLAETMEDIAREWSAFAQLLKRIADEKNAALFSDASRAMRRLAMREENFWGKVLDTVGRS
jgi:hypothetical protein